MNAVITGASRGIGKAIAEVFAAHGYDLYLSSRNENHLLDTINELKSKFPNISINGSPKPTAREFWTRLCWQTR